MKTHYPALEAAYIADITYRQLDYWTTKRLIRCSDPNPGNGNRREFTAREVRVLSIMAALVRDGLDPNSASKIARRIVTKGEATLGGLTIREDAA